MGAISYLGEASRVAVFWSQHLGRIDVCVFSHSDSLKGVDKFRLIFTRYFPVVLFCTLYS